MHRVPGLEEIWPSVFKGEELASRQYNRQRCSEGHMPGIVPEGPFLSLGSSWGVGAVRIQRDVCYGGSHLRRGGVAEAEQGR